MMISSSGFPSVFRSLRIVTLNSDRRDDDLQRIRSQVESQDRAGATISVSVGVATFPKDGCEAESLMLMADRRLYAAKSLGRNRVCGSKADS